MMNSNLIINDQSFVDKRALKLFSEHEQDIYIRTNKIFAIIFIFQWIAEIIAALIISPRTWVGTTSQTHIHVLAAIFLGGAIISFPLLLIRFKPCWNITRHSVAIAQVLTSALLIHLTGGRIETHFHVFGSLAFLAFYRDWRILISASVIVALDHLIRGVFWPQSVYGITYIEPWRWVEHAGWVVFIDVFLIVAIRQSIKEMKEIANRQAKMETIQSSIEKTIFERTIELQKTNKELQEQKNELNKALQELKNTQIQLVQSGKMAAMGELAAGVAHELTQPLLGIKGFASSMLDDFRGFAKVESDNKSFDINQMINDIDIILKQTDRMSKIVSSVREFARNEDKQKSAISINKPIEDALLIFENLLKTKSITIERSFDKELPCVFGNVNQIEQIFINLISNSRDAIDLKNETDGRLKIVTRLSNNKKMIIIEFSDNGIGMNKETQKKVFDAFFTTKPPEKGTGLGMSIVSKIVDENKGKITVESVEGSGTTFTIALPVAESLSIKEPVKTNSTSWKVNVSKNEEE